MEVLKNIYSPSFYDEFSKILVQVYPSFDKESFKANIYTSDFEQKELKERMRHTTLILNQYLPDDFSRTIAIFRILMDKLRENGFEDDTLVFMFLPDYIELFGINDFEASINAFEQITQFVSCEFAVRPFILKYKDRMIEQMIKWSKHSNHKVRRLSSEGSRPRLPWAMALPFLKKDPGSILPLLENLKNDTHEWVRRSVANNLNDISKDHPEIIVDIAKRWKGINKEIDWIVKHGCRTLLKKGNDDILKLYGLDSRNIILKNLNILTSCVRIGNKLDFSFEIENHQSKQQVIRLEYRLYYKKANGDLSHKIFKISERLFMPNERILVERSQSFKIITTRKFYIGEHRLSVIVNGKEMAIDNFQLLN